MAAFARVPEHFSFPENEQEILKLWDELDAFQTSMKRRMKADKANNYVFYDGPPFATGLPHYGHFVASTIKDVVPRYFTMRGKYVERRFGWDTHGLPIEMETEKALGLSGPSQIRAYGIDRFNEACRSGVLKYTAEWRQTIRRLGRWIDFDNDYKTMDKTFMESVWWAFKSLWDKGLIYQDFRVMPYSWRLSTPLSNFEANSDYRDVQDPAITVTLPLLGEANAHLLVWTTTPWTLPANVAVAVGPDIDYVRAQKPGDDRVFILTKARVEAILGKEATIVSELKGHELLGQVYAPLFSYLDEHRDRIFKVISAEHVTTEDGTGLVHMAPAFGEEDFQAVKKAGLPFLGQDFVDEEGRFAAFVTEFAGQNIKEADPKIIRHLKEAHRLLRHDTLQHNYPFCWRSGTPLIYKAVPSWFVEVTAIKDRLVELNREIHWVPEFVGDKRFGNWLADAQDWTISRNRFWGTPIPLWKCTSCPDITCIGSAQELEALSGQAVSDLHSHHIDALTFACACGGVKKRIPEVFDCWFDTGCVPYAQVHYPFENQEAFKAGFPAEFIAEGLDQTRAWFYVLLVLSTALFDKKPFNNVVVNGLVLAEDGSKMSKSKRNYPDPSLVLDAYGADALRAYLINSPVVRAEPLLFSEKGVREVVRLVMIPWYNCWSFFVQYANIDGWDPKTQHNIEVTDRPEIDRWILSKLQSLVQEVNTQMEGYYLYRVIPPMMEFIDDLTNWYIRLGRRRFWKNAQDEQAKKDKAAAYATLYEVLVCFAKVLAPVLPFMSERLYQELVVKTNMLVGDQTSVHFCDYPAADVGLIDTVLEQQVAVVRQVVRMGRALREKHKLKTRQPLKDVTIVTHELSDREALLAHQELIKLELNVKAVVVQQDDDALCDLQIKPNFKTLGKRFGARMKDAAALMNGFGREELAKLQQGEAVVVLDVALAAEDLQITRLPKEGVVVATEGHLMVALETTLDDKLISEGLMRETLSQLQKLRKDTGLNVTDRIELVLGSDDAKLHAAIELHQAYLKEELLASSLVLHTEGLPNAQTLDIDGLPLSVALSKA